MKYRVSFYQDGLYEVIEIETNVSHFQGTLSDCEAWIRLTEAGYM